MKTFFKVMSFALIGASILFTSCKPEKNDVEIPLGLKFEKSTDGQDVLLTWRTTEDMDGFELEVKNVTAGNIIQTTVAVEKKYTLKSLLPGTYTWKVRAQKGNNYSSWADGEGFAISDFVEDLNPPTNLGDENVTAYSAVLTFTGTGEKEYQIQLDGTIFTIQIPESYNAAGKIYVYPPMKLDPKKSYIWKVRAKQEGHVSTWTANHTTTTKDASSSTQWAVVSMEFPDGRKEVWGVDERNQETGKYALRSLYYDTVERSILVGFISRNLRESEITGGISYPNKDVMLKFPSREGNFVSFEADLPLQHSFPYLDYTDFSPVNLGEIFGKESWVNRWGDWSVVFEKQGGVTVSKARTTNDTQNPGNTLCQVTGVYEAPISYNVEALGGTAPTAKIKVEFNGIYTTTLKPE